MPIALRSMSSRLDDISAILGEYMLKGWTLTDLQCQDCRSTPLMREPAGAAAREGRAPIQFCASCDGRPEGRVPPALASVSSSASASTSTAASVYGTPVATPTTDKSEPSTQRAPSTSNLPASPPRPTATARGDPDAAADAIGELLLQGYSLLQDTCPEPTCHGVPLVGYPRRKDGTRDSKRLCVSCGSRWVDEKDLNNAGMRIKKEVPVTVSPSLSRDSAPPVPPHPPSLPTLVSTDGVSRGGEPESPRSKARRELYAYGNDINAEVERIRAREMASADKGKGKGKAPADSETSSSQAAAAATAYTSGSAVKVAPESVSTPPAAPASNPPKVAPNHPIFVAEEQRSAIPDGKLRVVLISTGSVASVKIPNIVSSLRADGNIEVQVVSTDASRHFFDVDALEAEHPGVWVWSDKDEWSDWKKIGDPILHIELRRWADLVVIAPVSADMLAKIAGGLCDNLPLSLLRALNPETPVVVCPAMNTFMYSHPLTARHVSFVRQVLNYYILGPKGAGKLACGDVGAGKMTEWTDIVQVIRGYAAAFRNQAEGKSLILDALLTESISNQGYETAGNDIVFTPQPSASSQERVQERVLPRQVPSGRRQASTNPEVIHVKHTPQRREPRPSFCSIVAKIPATVMSYLLFPLLMVLHLVFTISSIILRIVQSRPEPLPELTKPAPNHLGLVFVPGKGPRKVVVERYVESVRRAVVWAGEWGVATISVWDGQGLGIRHHADVTSSLLDLPPSPPSSTRPPSPLSNADGPEDDDEPGTLGDETVTKSAYVNTPSGPRLVEVHFLAPSASDVIARVSQQYIRDGITARDINERDLGRAVFAELGISSDPDLMIIHHLSPPGFWRGLLPRPAPELWGYPAWALRITEIYTHPPPLPFYLPFIGRLLHNSPLPILRKLGASFPDELDVGVLDTDAWDGAQSAWEKVEQRRGK